jgi:hypothetical protein
MERHIAPELWESGDGPKDIAWPLLQNDLIFKMGVPTPVAAKIAAVGIPEGLAFGVKWVGLLLSKAEQRLFYKVILYATSGRYQRGLTGRAI